MDHTVTLAPPGAGLPWYQRLFARVMIARYIRRTSEREALALFRTEGDKLLALARGLTPAQLAERVLVPPQRGLEDSSRYWSVAMTLEHLVIVNDRIAELVVALSANEVPAGLLTIAEVKPNAEVDAAACADWSAALDRFEARVAERTQPMGRRARFAHPWFGPFTAHDWLSLAGLHQHIHRKQVEAIRAGLGRPGPRVVETTRPI